MSLTHGDYNAETLQGVARARTPRTRRVLVGTTPIPLEVDSLKCLWVIVQNQSSVNIFIGGSDVANSGSNLGIRAFPSGDSGKLSFADLQQVYVVAASGTDNVVVYMAGIE